MGDPSYTDQIMLVAIANGCFFNIGARLARYTQNDTYLDWSERTWDWLVSLKYVTDDYTVYDGAYIEDNCTAITKAQFSYNAAVLLQGAAFMYNYVSPAIALHRPKPLLCAVAQAKWRRANRKLGRHHHRRPQFSSGLSELTSAPRHLTKNGWSE
jgi:predicted alpha-1,6-mannanase (GH76 family)